jgi:hypothetical protein
VKLTVTFAALLLSLSAVAQEAPSGGPSSILVTYRCDPASRPAFRAYLRKDLMTELAKLKSSGILRSYQVLFNAFTTTMTWDAMAVLRFADYSKTQRWKEIERTQPGGLDAAGLKLAKSIDTYSADLPWEGQTDDSVDDAKGVYYVIPYEYSSADQYRKYVDAYVIPQVKGWMKEGVLSGYQIFMNRYQVGRPWDSLFVYHYRDLESFGRRDETVAKVRLTLVNDPEWKRLSDLKQSIRTESENTIAEALQPLGAH